MKLTKKKIATTLQIQKGLDAKTSQEVVDLVFQMIENSLNQGDSVQLYRVGTLIPTIQKERVHKGFKKTFVVKKKVKIKFIQSPALDVKPSENLTPDLKPKPAKDLDDFGDLLLKVRSLEI